ncbi:ribosomal-protein-alanine acetyltransferase [Clostridia bacterium]|nr:ribosomal-protein-alanine acetyltransferase [Clostridia bacterium]
MNAVIRPLPPESLNDCAALERACFSTPWTRAMLESELTSEYAYYIACELDGRFAGYAGLQIILDVGHVTTIAVRQEFRRLGLAVRMMEHLLDTAKTRGLSEITLEVRESNIAAIGLYQRLGFLRAGLRRFYYQQPTEDAIIMTLYMKAGTP